MVYFSPGGSERTISDTSALEETDVFDDFTEDENDLDSGFVDITDGDDDDVDDGADDDDDDQVVEDVDDEEEEELDIELDELEDIFEEEDAARDLFINADIEDVDWDLMTTQSPSSNGNEVDEEGYQDDDHEEETENYSNSDTMNVLLIMTDDMRPQLESYQGEDFPTPYMNRKMYTPNLDQLAESSLLLKRAYVQYSLCGPSRTSMLTSRRPDTTRIFGNNNYWRVTGGNFTTLPQYFKERGYVTKGFGKIFHRGKSSNKNDPISWTERYYMPPYTDNHYLPKGESGAGWKAVSAKERQKVPLSDEYSVLEVNKHLTDIADDAIAGRRRFFYAVGFKKPHLSLICPEEHYNLYPLEQEELYMPDKQWQTPSVKSTVDMGENEGATAEHLRVIPDEVIRHLRRGYFACISFIDSLVGKVVKQLERVGLSNNTVVVFAADHGYHLGENDHWGKVSNYERATHVPMMIRVPGRTDSGVSTRSMVEAIDLYPTIVEAAGLKKMKSCPNRSAKTRTCTDGKSMMHLADNPDAMHKKVVYSQIASGGQFMSYTLRTERYRLIDWAEVKKKIRPDGLWDLYMDWELSGWPWWTALYDRKIDPEERFNRTGDPQYRTVESKLRKRLHTFVDRLYDHPKHFVKGH